MIPVGHSTHCVKTLQALYVSWLGAASYSQGRTCLQSHPSEKYLHIKRKNIIVFQHGGSCGSFQMPSSLEWNPMEMLFLILGAIVPSCRA